MESRKTIRAAGAVVWRKRKLASDHAAVDVLLVHRPKYDDWSFPKGKLDPDESSPAAAVREVEEETGARVRLGVPLATLDYPLSSPRGAWKAVTYWSASVAGGAAAEDYVPNREIDAVRWVKSTTVRDLLTYDRDRRVLDAFDTVRSTGAHRSRTVILLRHAAAVRRSDWGGPDLERPLSPHGKAQAGELGALLDAFGVERVVSSEAARCIATVEPYADRVNTYIVLDQRLDEQESGRRAGGPDPVFRAIDELLDRKRPVVVCGHRPILPWMFDALGIEGVRLEPGQMAVVHHRNGEIFGTEIHPD